ncbi:MAG TPA: FG-GAP-like repeat-containing protein, partial [Vicinamibacterales bacterium]
FNRDGKIDLAVANSGSNDVSVLLGNGNGTFQTAVSYSVGTTPEAVIAADFNRDGKLDLAVANSASGTVSILLGNGDGTFQTATTFAVGTNPIALAAADLNRDGKLDLVVANSGSGNVSVLIGNGSGGFAAAVNYTAGTSPYAIVAGDFNGDGLIDVAVALNGSNGAAVLLGTGTGLLGSPTSFPAGTTPYGIAAGDFNHDGTTDLVVANSGTNNVSVLLNTCPVPDFTVTVVHNGTFTQGDSGKTYTITAKNSGGGTSSGIVSVADALPSGVIASAMAGSGWTCTLSPLACTRNDTLAPGASFPPITLTVNVTSSAPATVTDNAVVSGGGELNTFNDSGSDVAPVAATTDLTIAVTHTASFTQGSTGKSYFIAVKSAGRGATSGQITVTDSLPAGLTATGISGAGWNCTLGSLTCTRSDSFPGNSFVPVITLTVNVASNAPISVINSATVSGGGETVITNDTATDPTVIWTSQTCGTLGGGVSYPAGTYPYGLAKGDFNHDGKIDLVTSNNSNGSVSVLLGGTGGTFGAPVNYTVGSDPLAVTTGDFNGDGNLDIAVVNYYSGSISVLLGNGDGTFAPAVSYAATNYPTSIVVADFNGDGNLDVAVSSAYGNLAILLGNGNGTFQTPLLSQPGFDLTGVTSGDFDGDGIVDLFVSDYYYSYTTNSYNVLFLKGKGDGTFQTAVPLPVGYYPSGVYAADFNGDGKLDVAVPRDSSGAVTIILGNGDGTFQTAVSYSVNGATRLAIDDLNGDGKLDIVATSYYTMSTLLGNGDGTFQTATSTSLNYYNPGAVIIGDFNGDGRADIALTNSNSYPGGVVVFLGACPDLTLTKTHVGSFIAGGTGTYTVTVTNAGGSFTGLVAVTDVVPDGLLITNMSGSGWTCDVPNSRCTINQSIAGGGSLPPITVTVSVSKTAAGNVVNQATVSAVGDSNVNNNTAYDPTTIVKAPDLTISKTHNGSFVVGQSGRTYTIIVSNAGAASTSGTVTMSDFLPFGLTATAISGAGWNCSLASTSCTRTDALAPGSAYPAIVLTVNVAANANSLTNVATVSGGGDNNSSNNSASDYTVVLNAPTNVVATAVLSSQVSVSWSAVVGAAGYQVLRSNDNISFAVVGNASSTSFLDTSVAANTAFFYCVRAVDATATGPVSASDLAMTVFFTNDLITPGATPILAVHVLELRSAINILRAAAGLSATTFTDSTLSGTPIKAVHFTELQTALNQARGALLLPAIVYTVSTPSAGNPVYGALIRDLRNGLK